MRSMLLGLALLALGCSADGGDERLRPTLGIDPVVSDLALSAVVMWERASGGLYEPSVHIGCDATETYCIRQVPGMLTECLGPNDPGIFRGCSDSRAHEIRLSEGMPLDEMISTIAHELGHGLGLGHGPSGLMNETRGHTERHSSCIDQATLDAFSVLHRPDPSLLAVTCYGADVRTEMFSQLAAIQ